MNRGNRLYTEKGYIRIIAGVLLFLLISGFLPGNGISFVQMVQAEGITNVTQGKTATASSCMLPYKPERAVDGIETQASRWVSANLNGVTGQWLTVNLAGCYTCNRWSVKGIEDSWLKTSYYSNCRLSGYTLYASTDGTNWYGVDTGSGSIDRTISNAFAARYVKLQLTAGSVMNNKWAAVQEFKVYGYPTVLPTVADDITVVTKSASEVSIQSSITADGGDSLVQRGIVYSTSIDPTITDGSDIKIAAGTGVGSFTVDLTGLALNTTYYARAYASNAMGTSYGKTVSFNTLSTVDIALTGGAANTVYGQAATYTATLSVPEATSGPGTPTGGISFLDGDMLLGTVPLNGLSAEYTVNYLTPGTHSIKAVYNGDTGFASKASTVFTQTVDKAITFAAVSSSPNPSVYGQPVTYTAVVSATAPGGGIPSGTVTFKDGAVSIGSATLAGGTATCTTSGLSVGSHSITVAYNGDGNYNSSTSSALTQTINKSDTTVLLSSSLNPSDLGQTVTFTATVGAIDPGSGTHTGTVTFYDGGVALGAPVTLSGGTAAYTTSLSDVGSHSIIAVYSGDGNNNGNTSSPLTQTVNKLNTTTALTGTPNPSTYRQEVTFTASVTMGATGTITFMDGITALGTATLSGDGTAAFTTPLLVGGSHSITAVYGGDSLYNSSTSAPLTQVVNTAASVTVLSSSSALSTYGQSITYTVTVTAGATGTVTFMDGADQLGMATLSGEGTATFSTAAMQSGSHNISAVYNGDANYSGSTSVSITQTVIAANPTIILSGSPNPSAYGQTVTFTAALPSGASGTVTFKDGATALGAATLDGAGTATYTISSLAVAQHSITATYEGDLNYSSVTSTALTHTVNAAASETTLGGSPAPSTYGQSVTFTATVTAGASGTVSFMDGSAILGTGDLSGTTATFTTSALTGGSHSITAVYGGDSNYGASTSPVLTQVVNAAATITILSCAPNPSTYGQPVTFTAAVIGGAGASGTVTFKDGSDILGIGVLSGSTAAFTTSALTGGSHSITAVYGGDSNYGASTSPVLAQVVNAAATSTTLLCTPNPSTYGQTVTITATLPFGTTGTVTFKDGAVTLGTAAVSGGRATLTTASMAKGDHSITAIYGGDANYIGNTSSVLTQVVNAAATAVSLGCSPNASTFGQPITLTAAVSSGATGTVSFKEGATILGTSTVSSSGTATLTIPELSVGTHTFEALYSGDANFAPATSGACTHTVAVSAAVITLKSSLPASIKGQEVTFTAEVSVSAPGSGTPTGTVTFMDGGAPLATAALSGGIATFTTASLEASTHNITAVYGGDGNFGSCISVQYSYIVGENAGGKVAADKSALAIGFATGDDEKSVKGNISLADEGSIFNSLITWTSSDEEIIEITDYTGYVYRPSFGSGNANVTVTAEVYNDGVVDTKNFDLIVFELPKAEPTSAEKVAADKAALAISYTAGEDEESVKGDISLPEVGLVYGSAITWKSSDPSVIGIEAGSGKFIGEVTRPLFASGNADVTVTAYVYNDGTSDERDFQLTVLKLPRSNDDSDKPRDRGNSDKPEITVTTSTDNAGTAAEVTVTTAKTVSEARVDKSGNASATITPVQVSEAIDRAVEVAALQAGGAVAVAEIEIIAAGDVKSVEAIIPGNAMKTAAESNLSALTVSTPVASVTFDQRSLDTISQEAGGSVNIKISKLDTEALSEEVQTAIGDRPVFDFSVTSGGKAITQFGGSVTVAIPYEPKAGEDVNALVIYYINGDRKLETIRDCIYDSASGMIRFTTSHFSRYAIGYNKVNFTDVPENAWYQAAVTFTSSRGISNGTGDGKYGPQERLTRGQFIVMAMRAFGIEPDENPSINFSDAGDTYYTGYLAVAKRLGLTKGTGENKYSPDKEISRQEMFTLLYTILESKGRLPEAENGSKLSAYTDSESIAVWAKDAMSLFVGTGTIKGSNGTLAPEALTSRAEMAQVLYRLIAE